MEPSTITSYLAARPYPGRGLLLSRSGEGAVTVSIFLTGRSQASQARKIVCQPGTLEVVPTDGAADDPLRHYYGVIAKGMRLVAGNGRQVSYIADGGAGPATAEAEFAHLAFEPDPPIFTPRLSAVVDLSAAPIALLGIAARGSSGETVHQVKLIRDLTPGEAWLMHTYDGNVDTPDASGFIVHLTGNGHNATGIADIWNALSPQYRVAIGSVTAKGDGNWSDGEWVTQHRE